MPAQYHRGLFCLALCTALLTLPLILLGSLVSSSGYGLSIPDWPLAFGSLVPGDLAGGALYEFAHRMMAAVTGLLAFLSAGFLWSRDPRPLVRRLGLIALLLIVVEILLGGIGVLSLFPSAVQMLHAALAHLFFALMVALAIVTSAGWFRPAPTPSGLDEKTSRGIRALASMILIQTILGAVVRHGSATWVFLPALLLHVVTGLGITISSLTTALALRRTSQDRGLLGVSYSMVALVALQWGLGPLVLLASFSPGTGGQPGAGYIWQSVAHVTIGALLLGAGVYLALVSKRGIAQAPAAEVSSSQTV
ncbi:MAG: COX15/CtaA family protein [Acidobacteriota bacterium]